MTYRGPVLLLTCAAALVTASARGADAVALRDGDRVVLVGNTLIEREQRTGYWETALTSRYPTKNITFRNLGWSGDTVFGEARAGFGSPADGFRALKDHVLALKPTVILVGYGANEAFDGRAGLPRFLKGLETLLDTFAPTKARVVLLSPTRQEDLGRPLPDPTAHNKDLRLYAGAIRDIAHKRNLTFVDLYDLFPTKPALTDNGIHLTDWGYWRTAADLERGLGLEPRDWRIDAGADGKLGRRTSPLLPAPPPPRGGAPGKFLGGGRVLSVKGLSPATYTLTIDGKKVAVATAAQWAAGVRIARGPDVEQAERLRKAIVAKNRLYFHRWRPQNVTYLFGFRKHEQGNNAVEIPKFDPLVATKEKEIARLRVPVAHAYELKREAE